MKKPTIAVLGSHSALDVCRGAKDEGFKTIVIAEVGREKTYHDYYRSSDEIGCVDEVILLKKFSDIFTVEEELADSIFVPNRSFETYINFDYEKIEKEFHVPIFGNKYLLKIEERGRKPNQYDLLDEANIRYPKQFSNPEKIDRLCLVKVLEKERGFERAFFLVDSYKDYQEKTKEKIAACVFTQEQLNMSVIEEFILGVQVNFNFFYSPLSKRLELLGTDTRRQTNFEGFSRIPANYQEEISEKVSIKYEEAGHIAVTVLESLLEDVIIMGERFVAVTKKFYGPGIIGPFGLQAIVTPGPPKKEIIVIDVSPRIPGSPGIFATPYSTYLYGKPVSVGRRIAMEIKDAVKKNKVKEIVT